jgi:hypothetical protein
MQHKIFQPEEIIEFLKEEQKKQGFPLVMTFLSDYLTDNPDSSPALFDTLASTYVSELFKLRPKNSPDQGTNEYVPIILEKFRAFLSSNDKYDVQKILVLMYDSWLLEEQVMLLIKQGKTYEALESYVQKEKYKEAEEFCLKQHDLNNQKLFTILFEIYLNMYKEH